MDYGALTGLLDDLLKALEESVLAEEYRRAKALLRADAEARRLIEDFVAAKEQYETAARYGRYLPDYGRLRRDVYAKKVRMELHPTVARFRAAEEALDDLLHEIARLIAESVSPAVKAPGRERFFFTAGEALAGAGGGCGGGGACSCR
ncbi:MAG: YlbF family regulator [Hydrogenibacillus schlegelii]|uniref:YlbF family regulator n=1 Tax=Hydrogenibacillus schlegelii TaxID=1484 RepID=A0A947D0J3_HYDSH|nr:YlbF family regulator [Hydrogenibacillus schlegelii]